MRHNYAVACKWVIIMAIRFNQLTQEKYRRPNIISMLFSDVLHIVVIFNTCMQRWRHFEK